MTAEIVNLRQARKRKARGGKEETAAEQRAQHGRAKAEKLHQKRLSDLQHRRLDAHRRGDDGPKS